jgi:hypothetical protein
LVADDSDDSLRSDVEEITGKAGARYVAGRRRGLGANENWAVQHLLPTTDWVVFTGDDARVSESFIAELRVQIGRHGGRREIPTGIEYRNGVLVRPNRLDFLGYQSRPHADYSPGAEVETIVVQATAFPRVALDELSWLEVSEYGYDEVDMALKMRRLGWRFTFEPTLVVHHDQSSVGRDEYPAPAELARIYVRLRSYSAFSRNPICLVAFLLLAPAHLVAANFHRRDPAGAARALAVVGKAYAAWLRSLTGDWRRT